MYFSEDNFKCVYNRIESFYTKQKLIDQEARKVETRYTEKVSQATKEFDNKIETNKEQEKRLLAFIDIAKAHAIKLECVDSPERYDNGILSRLAVQINSSSHNDDFAEQLFTHASSQLKCNQLEIQEIEDRYYNQKLLFEKSRREELIEIENRKNSLYEEVTNYVSSADFINFIKVIRDNLTKYGSLESSSVEYDECEDVGIGIKKVKLPIPNYYETLFAEACKNIYDSSTRSIDIPLLLNIKTGSSVFIEYINENENDVLDGIKKFILNTLSFCDDCKQIIYVDPIRYSNNALGILQPLSNGIDSIIDRVPTSIEEVRSKLHSLISQINSDEKDIANLKLNSMPKRILVFHNFPQSYDSSLISQIQQLVANASHYNLTIFITNNKSLKNYLSDDSISFISTISKCISNNGNKFEVESLREKSQFIWFKMPSKLPRDIKIKYIKNITSLNFGNNYDERIGIEDFSKYNKGIRRLVNIPYGVDQNGKIQYFDFEDTNFASFICGASRSGKSTLLHTLITGIIKNNHPDDVELWLIDFKMTEFSRYINHLPPHVRYIILDESPELVYDIIDRLSDILVKRQNIFKGKWLKLDDVPNDRYMPEILVIIDEFSIMSQIIADSLSLSKDNYSLKLQALLAKGAALGLHFIFASQGFTSGTQGLKDFSKMQIQQRIAMKAEYNEIKETLDLKTTSDNDRAMMEQLPIRHVLVRVPTDDKGNHLKLSKVLFIDDYKKQENFISNIQANLHKAPKYDVNNPFTYIDKMPLVVDGSSYSSFVSKRSLISEYIKNRKNSLDYDETLLFVGEPRRMVPLYPIKVNNSFCENLLIVSPITEKMATASVLMSIIRSLDMLDKNINVWTARKNEVYRQLRTALKLDVRNVYEEIENVCSQIRKLKKLIENDVEGDSFIFLLGAETLIKNMSYQPEEEITSKKSFGKLSKITIEKRSDNEMDISSLVDLALKGKKVDLHNIPIAESTSSFALENDMTEKIVYDARKDLKFIMTHGPRLGYHLVLTFNSALEFNQSKTDKDLCRHKILFRMPKSDAIEIISSSNASIVANLDGHSFRYSNGLEELSFRPYLHPGLSWDGWYMQGESVMTENDEEYLM